MNASFQLITGAKRKLKHGEPPSKEAQEFVVRLAEQKPRPINKFIQEAFQTKYKRSISVRTIARYCEEAGLPTSNRRASKLQSKESPEAKPQTISPQLVGQIKKLVNKVRWLTAIPTPEITLHPDNFDLKAANAAIQQGNTELYLAFARTLSAPWWHPHKSTRIRVYLSHEEEAVLDRFLDITSSQTLKSLINEWESAVESYRKVKEMNAQAGDIKQAYLCAMRAKSELDTGLAKAVVALY